MSFMSKLFGRSGSDARVEELAAEQSVECPHGTLVPRWDSAEDLGKQDKITHYTCESCQKTLTPDEAAVIKAAEPSLFTPRP